jgi:hypothetical protein
MTYLIDITEERFKIAANQAVIDFIRRVNPFAHSDLGMKLIELAKGTAGARHYCPAFSSCAYVVLHTDSNVVFAIAFGMRDLAFRLPVDRVRDALARGLGQASQIGDDWLCLSPFPAGGPTPEVEARLRSCCVRAFRHACDVAQEG